MDEEQKNKYALEKVVRRLIDAVKEQNYINSLSYFEKVEYRRKNGL